VECGLNQCVRTVRRMPCETGGPVGENEQQLTSDLPRATPLFCFPAPTVREMMKTKLSTAKKAVGSGNFCVWCSGEITLIS
jgi:hypothetical protein